MVDSGKRIAFVSSRISGSDGVSLERTDIEPCGFDVILMDSFLTDDVIGQVPEVMNDTKRRRQMVEHNFGIARRFFFLRPRRKRVSEHPGQAEAGADLYVVTNGHP